MGAVHAPRQKEPFGKPAQREGRAFVVVVEFCPRLTRHLISRHKARTIGQDRAISLRQQLTHLARRIDAMDIDTTQ